MKVFISLILLAATCGNRKKFKWSDKRLKLDFIFFAAYCSPVDSFEPIDPQFDAARDTRILLQTRQNRLNPQQLTFRNLNSVQQSHFDRNRPTRVLVHGWWEDDTSDISVETSAEPLNYNDFNVSCEI